MGLFQYLLPWVTNSCSIYRLVQSLVPETHYMVLEHFSTESNDLRRRGLLLRSNMAVFTAKLKLLELVLHVHSLVAIPSSLRYLLIEDYKHCAHGRLYIQELFGDAQLST